MTDINAELEQIADEVFVDDSQLDEVAADAPKKGAGAPMPAEKLPGEVQDMGPLLFLLTLKLILVTPQQIRLRKLKSLAVMVKVFRLLHLPRLKVMGMVP